MDKPLILDEDKVNHFVSNLEQNIIMWNEKYEELWEKVKKVQYTKSFREFCIKKHDEWCADVNYLYLYFNK